MAIPEPSSTSTALVTGASSGIGREIARLLARRGHHVTLVARNEQRLRELQAELGGEQRATVLVCDLADAGERDEVARAVTRTVDVLVNNAGFGIYKPFVESDRQMELAQVRVLVEAVVDLTARWLPGMVERRRGCVINVSSVSAFQPLPGNAGYAAAKAHVLLFSEALHAEVKEHGVTVTAVCPGPVHTEFQERNGAHFADRLPRFVWLDPERVARDALDAADAGRRTVVPGGPQVRAAFAPNRYVPTTIALPIASRLMRG